jgi:hypothetical protein
MVMPILAMFSTPFATVLSMSRSFMSRKILLPSAASSLAKSRPPAKASW